MSSKNDLQEMHDELFRRALHIKNTTNRFCFLRESILTYDHYWEEADRDRLVKKMVTTFLKDYNTRPEFRTDIRMLDIWRLLGLYSKEYGMAGVLQKVDETGYFRKATRFYEMWAQFLSTERRWEDMDRVIEKCRKRCALSDGELDVLFGHLRPDFKKPEDNDPSVHVPVSESIVTSNPVVAVRSSPLAADSRHNHSSAPSPQHAQPSLAEAPMQRTASPPPEEKMDQDCKELAPPPPSEPHKEQEPPVAEFVPPSPMQQKEEEQSAAPLSTHNHTSTPSPQDSQPPLAETPMQSGASPPPEEKMEQDGEELSRPQASGQQKEEEPPVAEFVPPSPKQKENATDELDQFASPVAKKSKARAVGASPQILAPITRQEPARQKPAFPRATYADPNIELSVWDSSASEKELHQTRSSVSSDRRKGPSTTGEVMSDDTSKGSTVSLKRDFRRATFTDPNIEQSAWNTSASEKDPHQMTLSVPSDRSTGPSTTSQAMGDATLEGSPVSPKRDVPSAAIADPTTKQSVWDSSVLEWDLNQTTLSMLSDRHGGPSPKKEAVADATLECSPASLKASVPRATFADPNIEQSAWEISAFEKELPQTPSSVPASYRGGPSLMQEASDGISCDSSFEGPPVTIKPTVARATVADPNIEQSACETSAFESGLHQTTSSVPSDRRSGPSPRRELIDNATLESSSVPSKTSVPGAIFTDPNIEQSAWETSVFEKDLPQTPSSVSSGYRGGPSLMQEAMDDITYDSSFDGSPVTLKPPAPRAIVVDSSTSQSARDSSTSKKELPQAPAYVPSNHRFGLSPITEVVSRDTTFEGSPVASKPAFTRAIFADPNVEQSIWENSTSDKELPQTPSSVSSDRRSCPLPTKEVMGNTTLESSPVYPKPAFPRATFTDPNIEQSAWETSVLENDSPQTPSSVPSDRLGGPSPTKEVMGNTTLEGSPVCPKPALPPATFADSNIEQSLWDTSAFEKDLHQTPSSAPSNRHGGPSSTKEVMGGATLESSSVCLKSAFPRATFADPNIEQSAWESSVFEKDLHQTPSGAPKNRHGGPSPTREVGGDASLEGSPASVKPAFPRATFVDPNIEQSAWETSVLEKNLPQTPSSVPSDRRGSPSQTKEVMGHATLEGSSVSVKPAFPRSIFADSNIEQSAWEISASEKELPETPSSVSSSRHDGPSLMQEAMDENTCDSSFEGPAPTLKPAFPRAIFADPNIEQTVVEWPEEDTTSRTSSSSTSNQN